MRYNFLACRSDISRKHNGEMREMKWLMASLFVLALVIMVSIVAVDR